MAAEARFEPPSTNRPYNNRHDPQLGTWQYDADGRLLYGIPGRYTYDAAGHPTTLEAGGTTATLGMDGNGQKIKTSETHWDEGSQSNITETKYFVRSSVLGNQVLIETDGDQSHRTFVYAGRAVLAWQQHSFTSDSVDWERRDPSGASVRFGGVQQELDPFGSDAGISGSFSIPDEGPLLNYGGSYSSGGSVSYTVDGIRVSLDDFIRRMGHVATDPTALLEMSRDPAPAASAIHSSPPQLMPYNHPLEPYRPFDTNIERRLGSPGIDDLNALLALVSGVAAPQNTGRHIVPLGNLRKGLEDLLKTGDCAAFVQKLIDKANERYGGGRPHATSFWDAFSRIQDAGGYQLNDVPNGGTVSGDLFFGEFTNPSLPEIATAGPGTVHITPFGTSGRSARPAEVALTQARYAYKAFHETLHLAKRGWYRDRELARAGHAVDGTTAPEYKEDDYLKWSGNFDEVLKRHCAYPFK